MKDIKPLSSKKPPVPDADHTLIEAWIAKAMPGLQDILKAIDKQVRKELKQPVYAIKWGKAYYGSAKLGWCIELVAYDISVNIVFLNGSRLRKPPELGGETRYVKVRSLEEAQSAELKDWIKQSCSLPGWKAA